jgi:hypothetical protein
MMIIIAASVIAIALTCIITLRSRRPDPAQLNEPRAGVPTMGIQIICGDCSGDEERPLKTYLNRLGNCAQCGGHSYILAAHRALYAQQLIVERLLASQAAGGGRVLPFEAPLSRAARAEKIAV